MRKHDTHELVVDCPRWVSRGILCVYVCVCARAFSLVAPPDAKDGTPYLQVAIEKDSPDMVRLLVYQGARLAPVGEACFAAGAGP